MSQMHEITWDSYEGGYTAFCGEKKVAVMGTANYQGFYKDGQAVYGKVPRDHWALHFTSPIMSVALLRAVLASLDAFLATLPPEKG